MKRWLTMLGCLVPAMAAVCGAQQAPPLSVTDFESGDGGFIVFGTGAACSVTAAPDEVHSGKQALKYQYEITPGQMGATVQPLASGAPAALKAIRMWVKSDIATPVALVVAQKGNDSRAAIFTPPAGKWQEVMVALADLSPMTPEGQPVPKTAIVPSSIEAVGIAPLAQLFAQAGGEGLGSVLGLQPGKHTICIDDVELLSQAPGESLASDAKTMIDDFSRPQVNWIVTGNVSASLTTGAPLNQGSLKLNYEQKAGRLCGALRFFVPGKLAGTTRLQFSAASSRSTMLVVQVEEEDGGKYSTQVALPGGNEARQVSLSWNEFRRAQDSKDTDAKLSIEKVKQLSLFDLSLVTGQGDQVTVWLGRVRANP